MADTVTGGDTDTAKAAEAAQVDETAGPLEASSAKIAADGSNAARIARDLATVLGVKIMIVLLVWVARA
jgi:hypothetical protein